MITLKGPGIFLAQFASDTPPFNSRATIAAWAASLGYKGIQIPTTDDRLFNLAKAAQSQTYCDDLAGMLAGHGLSVTELSTHLQGQLVAVHPAYESHFDGFAPPQLRGRPAERQQWAVDQLKLAARASRNLGLNAHATFSGALAWHLFYRGRNVPRGWSRKHSPNSASAGGRFWMLSMKLAWMSALNCIPARICTTA